MLRYMSAAARAAGAATLAVAPGSHVAITAVRKLREDSFAWWVSVMGPYSAMAKAAFALNAWTAAFREAVLVKVPGDGEGGGEDDAVARSTGSHCNGQAMTSSGYDPPEQVIAEVTLASQPPSHDASISSSAVR